jgi:hypothetical protein
MFLGSPGVSPAYIGVGYIIGPTLGALAFSGGIIAWGLLTPIILYFIGPGHGNGRGGRFCRMARCCKGCLVDGLYDQLLSGACLWEQAIHTLTE